MNKIIFFIVLFLIGNLSLCQSNKIDKKNERAFKKSIQKSIINEDFNQFRTLLLERDDILKLNIDEKLQSLLLNKLNNSYFKERAVFNEGLSPIKGELFVSNCIKIKELRSVINKNTTYSIYCRVETKNKKQFLITIENIYKVDKGYKFDGLIVFSRVLSL